MKKRFRTCDNKGFYLTFDNGLTLSTQFGPGNYSDNYDAPFIYGEMKQPRFYESDLVEVAIFNEQGEWLIKEYQDNGDDVLGRIDFNEWLKIVEWCKNWKSI